MDRYTYLSESLDELRAEMNAITNRLRKLEQMQNNDTHGEAKLLSEVIVKIGTELRNNVAEILKMISEVD